MSTQVRSFARKSTISLAALAAVSLVAAAPGCQKADDAVVTKLDEISSKLDKLDTIERKLAAGRPRGPSGASREAETRGPGRRASKESQCGLNGQ